MPRFQQTFNQPDVGGLRITDILVGLIIILSIASVGLQTSSLLASSDKEIEKKASTCINEFKQNDCNAFNPSEKCKPLLECIKSVDEPFWAELGNIAFVGFQQMEKLSVIPLVIIGLIIISKISWGGGK